MSGATPSQQRLATMIEQADGWLPFEKFMAEALYHPKFGYYSARIRNVGSRGDFTTTGQQSPLLGQALARWAGTQKRRLPKAWNWHVIEAGGGSGCLARTFLQSLGMRGRLGLNYHLVEISQPLREHQREKLRGFRVFWHNTVAEALRAADGKALIFSNELVDAFPCRRMKWIDGEWHELGLSFSEGELRETTRAISAVKCRTLASCGIIPSEVPIIPSVEVHSTYRNELEKIAQALTHGVVLTIDYGDRFPQVYHRQPGGTVRGYIHHLRVDGMEIYQRIGQQDITADVNFTDLENWGAELGWRNESLEMQRDFLIRQLGSIFPEFTMEARLLDPIGAGGSFKVLQQTCGLAVSS